MSTSGSERRPREGIPRKGDEFPTLTTMLDWLRRSLASKLDGLSEDDARRKLVSSRTTLLGLVKHAAVVEAGWFQHCFRGDDHPYPWPDYDGFDLEDSDTAESVLALYRSECDKSRAITEAASPDDPAARPWGGRDYNLRYILIHMIEETARHAGHADILREQIDGSTGEI